MVQYKMRAGTRVRGIDPDTAAAELSRIADEEEGLTPNAVVAAARPKKSLLHKAFEWDDSVAAEQHREWQARQLIKAVVVISANGDQSPAFVNVIIENERSYKPIDQVIRTPSMFQSALEILMAKLAMAELACNQLQQAARVAPKKAARAKIVSRKVREARQAAAQI